MRFQSPISGSQTSAYKGKGKRQNQFQSPISGSQTGSFWRIRTGAGMFQSPISGSQTYHQEGRRFQEGHVSIPYKRVTNGEAVLEAIDRHGGFNPL